MRYLFIKEHRGQFSVSAMCRVLKVSSSGYYDWSNRKESMRSQSNRTLTVEIKRIHEESKQTYGSPRVYKELRAIGHRCSRKRVTRLMRANDLKAKQKKRFKATTNSKHSFPVAENHLNRQFKPEDKNQVWAADLTYVCPEFMKAVMH
jgi:putative transposase